MLNFSYYPLKCGFLKLHKTSICVLFATKAFIFKRWKPRLFGYNFAVYLPKIKNTLLKNNMRLDRMKNISSFLNGMAF